MVAIVGTILTAKFVSKVSVDSFFIVLGELVVVMSMPAVSRF